ncbi:MauE/DoxX family redox-associated membrane protein [Roseimaritima sediminicola]|uniref:MauE/DoxX family redox-associated membrane protein n=1 Tax=Roseimaritima sediminicola TaxID=2662066 RepID=UPI00129824F4|nr:MauE/DoxX family redox-associated membrane protein [Roseimaritima sediminicola]
MRSLLAAVLLMSASAKGMDAARILGSDGLLSSTPRLSGVIGFEVFAAVFIALAPSRTAHRFGLLVFSGLACVAAWAWWTQADCGCFGSETPQGFPLVVDLIAIGLLLAARHSVKACRIGGDGEFRRQVVLALTAAVVLGGFATVATNWRMDATLDEQEMPAWFGDNLVGRKMPLLHDKRFAAVMPTSGEALIVLLRPDCEHCHEVAKSWREFGTSGSRRGVFVVGVSVATDGWTVMPGTVSAAPSDSEDEFKLVWGGAQEPFIAAPTFIAVRDQTVAAVVSGEDASTLHRNADWVEQLLSRADE